MEEFYLYLESMEIIRAQEILTEFTISDYPQLKKEDRTRIHKEVYKRANPSAFREQKKLTLEDVARILSGR